MFRVAVDSPVGPWVVEGDDRAVTHVYLPHDVAATTSGRASVVVTSAAAQLAEYFNGSRRRFRVRLADVAATDFARDVWRALGDIPFGAVSTYAQVAAAVGRPLAARAVGNALNANPYAAFVPCHRVVAASGLGGYGGGEDAKRYLLALEGVTYP